MQKDDDRFVTTRAADAESPPAPEFMVAEESTIAVLRQAEAVATGATPILIVGEPGTGKETLARQIHALSQRPRCPYLVDCRQIRGEELKLRARKRSTVILREVGGLGLLEQDILTSCLSPSRPARAAAGRIIATSSDNLAQTVEAGAFSKELFERLSFIRLVLPPMSFREKDTVVIAERFLSAANQKARKTIRIQPEALRLLSRLKLPSNFADLQALIDRTVDEAENGTVITAKMVEIVLLRQTMPPTLSRPWAQLHLESEIRQYEQLLIKTALQACDGGITDSARLLHVAHQALAYKIRHNQQLASERKPPKTRRKRTESETSE